MLKCSWIQLKENGHIWSISLKEVGEEQAGLLMTITHPCFVSLCYCLGMNLAVLTNKTKIRGSNMSKACLVQGKKMLYIVFLRTSYLHFYSTAYPLVANIAYMVPKVLS